MADQSPHLGAPIEVPWWAFVISAPPVILILLALIDRPSLAAVAVGVLGSVFTLVVLFYITTRSRNGHVLAIYFSGIYAVWFFIAVSWGCWCSPRPRPAPAPRHRRWLPAVGVVHCPRADGSRGQLKRTADAGASATPAFASSAATFAEVVVALTPSPS